MQDQSNVMSEELGERQELWISFSAEEKARHFRLLPPEEAQDLFFNLPSYDKVALLLSLSPNEAKIWFRILPPDDATDVIQATPVEDQNRLLALLDDAARQEVLALLAFAEDQAGGLMNPRFARLRPETTVEVAIRYLRRQMRERAETIYYAYVLDAKQYLLGVLSLRQLFSAPPEALVSEIMIENVIVVREEADQESVARVIAQHHFLALPVVDVEGRMLGIVTVDDIVDVVQEEATEDIQKLGAVNKLDAPYLNVPFISLLRKRAGWLSGLFIGEMLTATAMGHFEKEISQAIVLAVFLPLIISSGGNSGSQAATLVVRSLALTECSLRDWFRVLRREIGTGVALGTWLGLVGYLRVILWQKLGLFDYGEHYQLVALTVWLSLIGVVTFGTVAGSMLPFILKKVKLDPATSSAPFVATLVDVTGLIIYFTIAALILRGTLL